MDPKLKQHFIFFFFWFYLIFGGIGILISGPQDCWAGALIT
jgi:hypothetical protein